MHLVRTSKASNNSRIYHNSIKVQICLISRINRLNK